MKNVQKSSVDDGHNCNDYITNYKAVSYILLFTEVA